MEGLEIAEVRLSELEFTIRFDSEYYRPSHLHAESLLSLKGAKPLSLMCDFIIGPFGSAFTVENYTDDRTYRYIRGKDVKPMRLEENDNVYMPQDDFERLSKYALQAGDVLVSVVGTLGNAALVEERHLPAIFSCKSTALRVKNVEPRYLVTYLNCRYGQDLLLRKERGAVQKGLNLDDLRSLNIYVASSSLQKAVIEIHEKSEAERLRSKLKLQEAEALIIGALGLDNWTPPEARSYVRYSSAAFSAGRLDAEHFQIQYDDIESKIKYCKGGHTSIGRLARDVMNGAEVREYQKEGVAYLRVGDLKNFDIDSTSVVRIDPVAAQKGLEKIPLQKGDVLVSRSGSLAVTAVVEPEWQGALISSHLIRLRIEDHRIDPYFLALFLSCLPGKLQITKWSNGGVQPEISQPSLSNILVPLVASNVQQEIRKAILSSREQRQRATQLLDAAKRAVELAIEDSEAAALSWLAEAQSQIEA